MVPIMEHWKSIDGYPNYEVSDHGRVRSKRRAGARGGLLKPDGSSDYHRVKLHNRDTYKVTCVHRLVAEAFIDNPESKPEVNHKDGNKTNNHVTNLEWATISENARHAYRIGLRPKGERHPHAKLSDDEVKQIRRLLETGTKTQTEIGEMYGVHNATISRINTRQVRV